MQKKETINHLSDKETRNHLRKKGMKMYVNNREKKNSFYKETNKRLCDKK
jgi:hypothetical protein